jgi:hypothetical protein
MGRFFLAAPLDPPKIIAEPPTEIELARSRRFSARTGEIAASLRCLSSVWRVYQILTKGSLH